MFELMYDILDDLERISTRRSVERVIDTEPDRTTDDFYREFEEAGCTHLLTFRLFCNGDDRSYLPKIQELIDELLRTRYPDVPQCQLVDSKTIVISTRSSLETLANEGHWEKIATATANNKYVTVKVPLKSSGHKRRDILHLLNFFTALHTAVSVRYVYHLRASDYVIYDTSGYKISIRTSDNNAWTTKRKMYRLSNSNSEEYRLWHIWAVMNYLYHQENTEETGNIVKAWFYKYNNQETYRHYTFDELMNLNRWAKGTMMCNSAPEAIKNKFFQI